LNKLLLLAAAAASVLSLVGYAGMGLGATEAQRESAAVVQAAIAQRQACHSAVLARPEFAPLLPHLPDPTTGQFGMAQMTNETRPTAAEATLLVDFFDAGGRCFRDYITAVQSVRPDVATILDNEQAAAQSQFQVPLVERQITWAESARRSQRLVSETNAQIAAANQQWLAGNQAELNRRNAVMMQFMQNLQSTYETQMRGMQPIQQPHQTICRPMPNGTMVCN